MSKKILSFALAIVMLFSIMTISASATVADGKKLAFVIESADTLTAGENIDVTFSYELPTAVTDLSAYKLGQFQFIFSYDASVLTPVSRTWNSDYAHWNDASSVNFDTAKVYGWIETKLTAEEKSTYPSAFCIPTGTYLPGNEDGVTTASGWSLKTRKALVFTVTFKVAETYAGGSTNVAMLANSFGNATRCYAKGVTEGGKFDVADLDFSQASLTLSKGVTGPSVANYGPQVRWQGADNTQPKMDVAFRGLISGWAPQAEGVDVSNGEIDNIAEIGVMFSTTDTDLTEEDIASKGVQAYTVYDAGSDTYFYRAVVKGIDYTESTTLYYRAYIKIGTTYYLAPATLNTTGAAQYARAIAAVPALSAYAGA